MMETKKKGLLLTITGPTASGKTALAVEIAKELQTAIISCDSRQVYREMCIGTAVPEAEFLDAVKHHFIQTTSIQEPINANDFGLSVRDKLDELFQEHNTVVMVGGSGLYIDSVLKGIDDIPSPDPNVRCEIQRKIDEGRIDELRAELFRVDPIYYNSIDIQNPRRVLRGLEVYETTGVPLSSYLGNKQNRDFASAMIVLELDRGKLYSKINQRVDHMMEQGLIKEAESVYEHRNLTSLQTVGYQELFEYFDGTINLNEAIEKIKNNTRQYARKQETWFRRYDEAFRISALEKSRIMKLIKEICWK